MARYFTLDQARGYLPQVGRVIRDAVQAKGRYQEADTVLSELVQRILVMGGITIDTTSAEAYKTQRDSNAQTLKSALERLEEIGCLVKDLDVGLIDFPTLFRGEEVYLCWRMDEDDIEYWHGVHEGFAGRKAIDQTFLENHRGESLG